VRRTSAWGIDKFGIRGIWNQGLKGKGVKIAILDTGINPLHSEIVVERSVNLSPSSTSVNDVDGHGTHTAGTAAGRNIAADIGVAPESSLYVAKILGDTGETTVPTIMKGIEWAIENKVDIISMSLGGDGDIPMNFAKTISTAISNGIIIVVAAGNSGPYRNTVAEPGNFTPCVTVGAICPNLVIAPFSSRGSQIDIVAPGVDVISSYKGSNKSLVAMSGTSMATPFVAGVAALFIQKARSVGMKYNQQIFERLLKDTATDLGVRGVDVDYGAGAINPLRLIASVEMIASPKPTAVVKQRSQQQNCNNNPRV
jgi:subtilisin family serine protease